MQARDNRQQWDRLWTNVHLATMGAGYGIIENAALATIGEHIAWLGQMSDLPPHIAKETFDAEGRWITPGLIDCHTHMVYGGNRAHEMAMKWEGRPYAEIAKAGGGIVSTMHMTRKASEVELLAAAGKRLQYLLSEGVTTVEIKSGYGLDKESELKMLRVAKELEKHYPVSVRTTFLGAHALPPEFKDKDTYIEYLCTEILPVVAEEGLADAVDGFCESIGFTTAQMTRMFETAKRYKLPLKLHAEQLSDQGGAALAARYHALSADHLEYLSEDGAKAMGEAGTVAVLLPGAFFMLREKQKPPVNLLRQYGVKIALATDCNPGTSPTTSLLLMLPMGCVLFGLTPEEALLAVTTHAATALGYADRGILAAGKKADFVLWDINHPLELSCHLGYNPCAQVIQNGTTHA